MAALAAVVPVVAALEVAVALAAAASEVADKRPEGQKLYKQLKLEII